MNGLEELIENEWKEVEKEPYKCFCCSQRNMAILPGFGCISFCAGTTPGCS